MICKISPQDGASSDILANGDLLECSTEQCSGRLAMHLDEHSCTQAKEGSNYWHLRRRNEDCRRAEVKVKLCLSGLNVESSCAGAFLD